MLRYIRKEGRAVSRESKTVYFPAKTFESTCQYSNGKRNLLIDKIVKKDVFMRHCNKDKED